MDDDTIELKTFATFEIKDAEKGEVEAEVATLEVVDKDEDIITIDAIKDGSKVSMSSYGHDAVYGDAPVGKGKLFVEGKKVVFKGRMFLATARGRESFEVLKEMGPDQQWSFGFRILGAEVPSEAQRKSGARRILTKLDAFEVSPVIIGAGVGTRTLAVKSADDPPPDPAIEAARVKAEEAAAAETERQTKAAAQLAEINGSADRMFKRLVTR